MFIDFTTFILEHAEGIGTVVVVILVASLFIAGIVTERIHLGPEFRRLATRAKTLEDLLATQGVELTESRIAHASAAVKIEYLQQRVTELTTSYGDIRRELDGVRAELDRVRETWNPPSPRRTRQGSGT